MAAQWLTYWVIEPNKQSASCNWWRWCFATCKHPWCNSKEDCWDRRFYRCNQQMTQRHWKKRSATRLQLGKTTNNKKKNPSPSYHQWPQPLTTLVMSVNTQQPEMHPQQPAMNTKQPPGTTCRAFTTLRILGPVMENVLKWSIIFHYSDKSIIK